MVTLSRNSKAKSISCGSGEMIAAQSGDQVNSTYLINSFVYLRESAARSVLGLRFAVDLHRYGYLRNAGESHRPPAALQTNSRRLPSVVLDH